MHPLRTRLIRCYLSVQSFHNGLKNTIRISHHIVVPKAQDAKSAVCQIEITPLVIFTFRVLAAICLDNQTLLKRNKIHDPGSDRNLATKLHTCQTA